MSETDATERIAVTGTPGTPLTALVVDDSAAIREWVTATLAGAGVMVLGEATNGHEAVQLTERLTPDLVILDIRMPGGSGIEALKRIKNSKMAPLVVILTNHGYSAYRSRCAELGADYFVDKSKEHERLREIVVNLTAARNAERDRSQPDESDS